MSLLRTVEIGPEDADRPVVWLHGLGADGHDFAPLVPHLGLPDVRFVFPHAPMAPVTVNGGFVMRSWYDIRMLEAGPDRECEADIRTSAESIEMLLDRERDRGAERIVLAGFSQGGAMTYHVGLRFGEALAGLMTLSTYLVLPDLLEAEKHPANASTPLLACHGTHDDVVALARGRAAYDAVSPGREAAWHTFPCAHGVHERQIQVMSAWLRQRLES